MLNAMNHTALPFFNGTTNWLQTALPGTDGWPVAMKCRKTLLVPFQLFAPSGATGSIGCQVISAADGSNVQDISSLVDIFSDTVSGRNWCVFAGLPAIGAPDIAPGFYQYKVTLGSFMGFSEVFQVIDEAVCQGDYWELEVSNATDLAALNVLYQTGWKDIIGLFPGPVFDTPEIEREIEEAENRAGIVTSLSTLTKTRTVFESGDLPDWIIPFLARAGDLSEVWLRNVTKDESVRLERLLFSSKPQGPFLNIGRFSAMTNVFHLAGCDENFVLE